ncbi:MULTISPECIES: MBL fold metallo-hydrolase [Amycolatopsis]|uniref:MBL fold metallo-hydrolase n=1 Tax=Amycolatopsis TaxID=1813 RepID=UPI000569FBA8|nr:MULTISPECIES: MBL fold metallo-hydrolase [unclassified Amycolatopsis]
MTELADRVHAYIQPDGGWCVNNAGVLADRRRTILIDTAATERRAHRLRSAVAALGAAAPSLVVNTHHHGDHTFGNMVFAPRAAVLAHERTRTEMARSGLALAGMWPEVEWGELRVELPTLTFADRLTLHLDDFTVELIHPGAAHTTNDTLVWLPEQRVLFAGDVALSGCTPFVLMGSVAGTLSTLDSMRALEPEIVVCGHGPVAGPEVLDTNAAYLRWLTGLTVDGIAAGLDPLELARDVDLGRFADLLDSERLVANLHRAYLEQPVHGRSPLPLGAHLPSAGPFRDMITLAGHHPASHA